MTKRGLYYNEIDCSISSKENANLTTEQFFDSAEEYQAAMRVCRVHVLIWNVVPPILLIAGTFGNVLSIIIWSMKKMSKQTQSLSVMLNCLAVGDLLVLYTGTSRHYFRKASYIQWDLQKENAFLCKFHEFLVYFSLSFSAWMVVFIAIERCACVLCVNRSVQKLKDRVTGFLCGEQFGRRSAFTSVCLKRPFSLYIVIFLLGVVCTVVNGHFFWTRSIIQRDCKNNRAELPFFLDSIWPKVDLLFTSIVPCTLILVSTIMLSTAVCCCYSSSLDDKRDSQPDANRRSLRLHERRTTIRSQSAVIRKSNKITWTLIGIALTFILCVCPTRIFLVIFPSRMPETARYQPLEFFKYRLIWAILLMVEYVTYVINFMIYSLSNERFRNEARKILCRTKVRQRRTQESSIISPKKAPTPSMVATQI